MSDYAQVTFEPRRSGLRWAVIERTVFPNGIMGIPIKPFEHEVRRFWRRSSAATFAADASVPECSVCRRGPGNDCDHFTARP